MLYELFKTLKTGRKVTYWYGGRSRAELFYIHYFRDLEKEFPNFKFYLVLSDALPTDNWVNKKDINDPEGDGFTGFVHQVVIDQYLTHHEAPEERGLVADCPANLPIFYPPCNMNSAARFHVVCLKDAEPFFTGDHSVSPNVGTAGWQTIIDCQLAVFWQFAPGSRGYGFRFFRERSNPSSRFHQDREPLSEARCRALFPPGLSR